MTTETKLKPGATIQIGGDSVLKDYLACVVMDLGESVYCVTLGPGNLAGGRDEIPKKHVTSADDWKGPWPGENLISSEPARQELELAQALSDRGHLNGS